MREGERRYFWKETFSKKSYKIVRRRTYFAKGHINCFSALFPYPPRQELFLLLTFDFIILAL